MSELVVALDFQNKKQALTFAQKVAGTVSWVKVGLELFCAAGPELICELKELGYKVFVDLKFFDIPNTVRGAVQSATLAGADMLTLHILGGQRMAEAALEGREQGARQGAKPLLLGVTVLTSMNFSELESFDILPTGSEDEMLNALVLKLAHAAKSYYLDGIVCSGLEVASVKIACGADFFCLTPGIRLDSDAQSDDQRRIVTPQYAVRKGSNFLVVGRPITQALDPLLMAKKILTQM